MTKCLPMLEPGVLLRRLPPMAIPRIVHRIWLGDRALPPACDQFAASLARMFPPDTWTHVIWSKPPAIENRITGDLIERCPNPGAASDVARLEILFAHGGVYADVDVQAVTGEPPPWINWCACWAAKQNAGGGNFLIGAAPGAAPIRAALVTIAANARVIPGMDISHTMGLTGPDVVARAFASHRDASLIERPLWERYFMHHQMGTWIP